MADIELGEFRRGRCRRGRRCSGGSGTARSPPQRGTSRDERRKTTTFGRMGLLDGKKIVITGVLTDASLAFGVAQLALDEGADIVLTGAGRALPPDRAHGAQTERAERRADRRVRTRRDRPRTRRHGPFGGRREVGSRRWRAPCDRLRPRGVPRRRLHGGAVGRRGDRHAHLDLFVEDAGRHVRAADERGRRVRRARLRQPAGVAGLQLDGRREVGAAVGQPVSGEGTRAEGDPVEPRRRRPDQDDGRQVDPGLRAVRGHVGRTGAAGLGRQRLRRRSPVP